MSFVVIQMFDLYGRSIHVSWNIFVFVFSACSSVGKFTELIADGVCVITSSCIESCHNHLPDGDMAKNEV